RGEPGPELSRDECDAGRGWLLAPRSATAGHARSGPGAARILPALWRRRRWRRWWQHAPRSQLLGLRAPSAGDAEEMPSLPWRHRGPASFPRWAFDRADPLPLSSPSAAIEALHANVHWQTIWASGTRACRVSWFE